MLCLALPCWWRRVMQTIVTGFHVIQSASLSQILSLTPKRRRPARAPRSMCTTLGACIVFCASLAQPRFLAGSLAFAAGVML